MEFDFVNLGTIEYNLFSRIQEEAVSRRITGDSGNKVFFAEHPKVITFGRKVKKEHIIYSEEQLKQDKVNVIYTNRGGDVTMHVPGQVICYPVIDLSEFKKDLHFYLRKLEQVGIQFLKEFGLKGERRDGFTGVWVDENKVSSIGIGVKRWVAFHGISININTRKEDFKYIVPCGIPGVNMVSLRELLGYNVDMGFVLDLLENVFMEVFSRIGREYYEQKTAGLDTKKDKYRQNSLH